MKGKSVYNQLRAFFRQIFPLISKTSYICLFFGHFSCKRKTAVCFLFPFMDFWKVTSAHNMDNYLPRMINLPSWSYLLCTLLNTLTKTHSTILQLSLLTFVFITLNNYFFLAEQKAAEIFNKYILTYIFCVFARFHTYIKDNRIYN